MHRLARSLIILCLLFSSIPFFYSFSTAQAATVFPAIEAEDYFGAHGSALNLYENDGSASNSSNLSGIESGNYLAYEVDFGAGAAHIQVRLAAAVDNGYIEVRQGSPTGSLLATVIIPNTHVWSQGYQGISWSAGWRTVTAPISNSPTGPQNIYLVFKNPGGGRTVDIDWFRLLATIQPTTYYVSPSGSDSNPGTNEQPFGTIQHAVNQLLPGDTLLLNSGTYNELVIITATSSGTPDNRVTIKPAPGATPILDGTNISTAYENQPLLSIFSDYTTVTGFEVRNTPGNGIGGDGDFLIIDHMHVHDTMDAGISLNDQEGAQIIYNTVHDNNERSDEGWAQGIGVFHSWNTQIRYNHVYEADGESIGSWKDSNYTSITDNIVHADTSVGIYIDGADHLTVERNLVYTTITEYVPRSVGFPAFLHDLPWGIIINDENYNGWGTESYGCTDPNYTPGGYHVIRNNIVIGTRSGLSNGGFVHSDMGCTGIQNTLVENNTFVNIWEAPVFVYGNQTHTNTIIRNNILHSRGNSDSDYNYALYLHQHGGLRFENNLIYHASGSSEGKFKWEHTDGETVGCNSCDFAGFQESYPHQSNNYWGEPQLVALGNVSGTAEQIAANHKLTSSSPAIDAGASVNIDHDYFLKTRPVGSAYDIGAHEYNSDSNIALTPTPQPTGVPSPTPVNVTFPTPGPTAFPKGSGTGLQGVYFNDVTLTTPVLTRTDSTVNFTWGSDSPGTGVISDAFTVRWTGQVEPRYSEEYTFKVFADDGVRLWVNGTQLFASSWQANYNTWYEGNITLTAGQKYDIRLEYYESWGDANVKLYWKSASQIERIIPQSQLYPPCDTCPTPTTAPATPLPTEVGTPYGDTAASIPGRVEAENYNVGTGAYYDTDSGNTGGDYRNDNVDIEDCSDTGCGYNIGWVFAQEWLRYSVNVQTAGTYTIDFRVASDGQGGTFHLEVDGVDVTGPMTVPNTGGYGSWQTVSKSGVSLTAGSHVLRLVMDTNGSQSIPNIGNFNWMDFTLTSTEGATSTPTTTSVAPTSTPTTTSVAPTSTPGGSGTNLALNRTATQSSTTGNWGAQLAVDGNTDGNLFNGSVTHTQEGNQPWWQVDLGAVSSIATIEVWNRSDSDTQRLSNFYVLVSDTPFSSTNLEDARNQSGVSSYNVSGEAGRPTTFTVNRTGRYVRVQLSGSGELTIAEVRVLSQ